MVIREDYGCVYNSHNHVLLSFFVSYHRIFKNSKISATSGTRTAHPSEHLSFCAVRVARSLVFCVMFSGLLFVCFILSLLAVVVSVLPITVSDYLFISIINLLLG